MTEEEKEELEAEEPKDWETTQGEIEEEDESYGLISRIIGVFIEPSKAFRHIAGRPEIWGPILTAFVLMLITSFFYMDKMIDLTVTQTSQLLSDQGMTDEQITQALNITSIMLRLTPLTQTLGMVLVWLILGGLAYFVGLFMGQDSNYKSSLAVMAYSSLPAIVIKQVIIGTILMLTGGYTTINEYQLAMMNSSGSLYPLFGNPEMNINLQAALIGVDIFVIWSLILMAIGFTYANNVKRSHAWRTAIVVTLISWLAFIPLTALGLKQMLAS